VLPVTRDALIQISAQTGEEVGEVLDRLVGRELRRVQALYQK